MGDLMFGAPMLPEQSIYLPPGKHVQSCWRYNDTDLQLPTRTGRPPHHQCFDGRNELVRTSGTVLWRPLV